jgi:hypothetical protein
LFTQNILLLQKHMEKEVKEVKAKMKQDLEKQLEIHMREMQNTEVRFPMHTTNLYHSTFIQRSAVLMSSHSLPNFTSL